MGRSTVVAVRRWQSEVHGGAIGRLASTALATKARSLFLHIAPCGVSRPLRGVTYDVRRLTIPVNERAVERAIGRGLLGRKPRRPMGRHQRPIRQHVR